MNNLTIKPSLIHGQGVFSKKSFQEGDMIIDWEPCLKNLTDEEIKTLPQIEQQFVHNNSLLVSPSRYLNHSCYPNTKIIDGKNIALRNIQTEEELTIDYNKEDIPHLGMSCKCGSGKCRGNIELNLQQK